MYSDGRCFDGDSTLSFQIHGVEHLGTCLAFGNSTGGLEKTIGKGAFAVVDVGDDGKVTYWHAITVWKRVSEMSVNLFEQQSVAT